MKVLFTMDIPEELKEIQAEKWPDDEFYYQEQAKDSDVISKVDVLIAYSSKSTAKYVEEAKNLKLMMVFSAGVDSLPVDILKEKQVKVANVRGIHAIPMGEFAIGFMLDHAKKLSRFFKSQGYRLWEKGSSLTELAGHTLVVAGTGAIGSKVAELAKAFDMEVYGLNTTGHDVPAFDKTFPIEQLEEVAAKAEYFVSVLPNTEATTGLYKDAFFENMPEQGVFINIGRGSAVEESVLVKAAETKQIAAFYLDVLPEEPLPKESKLWTLDNVFLTPHVSGTSDKYVYRGFDIWLEVFEQFKKEEPLTNEVDLEKGY